MNCCAIDGQTLMIKISTFIQAKKMYVSSIAHLCTCIIYQSQPPYTKVDLDHVNLIRINKLPRITGGEVSGQVKELIATEEDLLIIQIKHDNTANKYIVIEGVDNQVLDKYCLGDFSFQILVGLAVPFNATVQ